MEKPLDPRNGFRIALGVQIDQTQAVTRTQMMGIGNQNPLIQCQGLSCLAYPRVKNTKLILCPEQIGVQLDGAPEGPHGR